MSNDVPEQGQNSATGGQGTPQPQVIWVQAPKRKKSRKGLWITLVLLLLLIGGGVGTLFALGILPPGQEQPGAVEPLPSETPEPSQAPEEVPCSEDERRWICHDDGTFKVDATNLPIENVDAAGIGDTGQPALFFSDNDSWGSEDPQTQTVTLARGATVQDLTTTDWTVEAYLSRKISQWTQPDNGACDESRVTRASYERAGWWSGEYAIFAGPCVGADGWNRDMWLIAIVAANPDGDLVFVEVGAPAADVPPGSIPDLPNYDPSQWEGSAMHWAEELLQTFTRR